jgi:hypothetical protein
MRILSFALAMVLAFNANVFAAPAQEDKMVAVVLLMDEGDDKQVVATIYTTLMAAEKVAKILDIEMVASDDPVQDDVFVFALKSEEQKDLTMKMFDEEGYELAAHRVMEVTEGSNYRALNVESLEDGTYMFQITDETGAELNKKVTIKRD